MSYTEAKKAYEALEINVEAALEKLKTAPVLPRNFLRI